jgi:hypothetical protein
MFYTVGDLLFKYRKNSRRRNFMPSGIDRVLIIPIGIIGVNGIVFFLTASGLVATVLG